jgi:hypothetical protein
MTRQELRELAKATGESERTIRYRGFGILPVDANHSLAALLGIECPSCGRTIVISEGGPEELPELADCDSCDVAYEYGDDEVLPLEPDELPDNPAPIARVPLFA